jgi:hypothetical protein
MDELQFQSGYRRGAIRIGTTVPVLLAALLGGCTFSRSNAKFRLPAKTQAAINQLFIGMTGDEAIAVMKPVSVNWARSSYGGTGSGDLYFQISQTRQLRLGVAPKVEDKELLKSFGADLLPRINFGPEFIVISIGHLEAMRAREVDASHNFVR